MADEDVLQAYLIHWNAPEWCASAARSVLDSDGVRVELTVVDNGQEAGPPLEELLPVGVRVLRTAENLGYAGGANVALADWQRRIPQSPFCLIGSHDLHVRTDTLGKVLRVAALDSGYGIIAPALVSPNQFSGGLWTGWRALQLPLNGADGVVERQWVSGTCIIIRRECAESVRGFDESFGSYAEDVDIGLRARDAGWKVGVATEAAAWGLGSRSSSSGSLTLANGVMLVVKRRGTLLGSLRAAWSLAWLVTIMLRRLVGTLVRPSAEHASRTRAFLVEDRKTTKRVLAILARARKGMAGEQLGGPAPYREIQIAARASEPADHPAVGKKDTRAGGEPLASVVITTRDRPNLADKAIRSALGQTIRDIEVVIVDDGSAQPFEPRETDHRVKVVALDRSSGVCAARNRGMAASRGRWITFLDDDDELVPEMLETSLAAARNSAMPDPVAVLSGVEVLDSSGRVIQVRLPVTLARGRHYFLERVPDGQSFTTQSTLVVEREVLMKIGGWDEEILSWEHDDLFLRLNAVCSIQGIPVVSYRVSDHTDGRLHQNSSAVGEGMERTVAKHAGIFRQHPRRQARFLAAIFVHHLKARRWEAAARVPARFLIKSPGRIRLCAFWVAILGVDFVNWYRRRRIRLLSERAFRAT